MDSVNLSGIVDCKNWSRLPFVATDAIDVASRPPGTMPRVEFPPPPIHCAASPLFPPAAVPAIIPFTTTLPIGVSAI